MIVVKYPPIKQGESEIEVRYNEYGICKVSRELMEKLIESYRGMVQKDREYEIRRQTIDECIKTLEESYPHSYVSDVIVGFHCAVSRLEKLKGETE